MSDGGCSGVDGDGFTGELITDQIMNQTKCVALRLKALRLRQYRNESKQIKKKHHLDAMLLKPVALPVAIIIH